MQQQSKPSFLDEQVVVPKTKGELSVVVKWMETFDDYLCTFDLRYLQFRKRQNALIPEREVNKAMEDYKSGLPLRLEQFRACLSNEDFDLLCVAPSCFDNEAQMLHSEVFGAVARKLKPQIREVVFHKECNANRKGDAGNESVTVDGVFAGMETVQAVDASKCNRVLIVDDVFANGKTVAAMARHLRRLGFSEHGQIAVAVPLRVMPSKAGFNYWKFIIQTHRAGL